MSIKPDNNINFENVPPQEYKPKPLPKPVSFIPIDSFKGSLRGYETNHFIKFLIGVFGDDITSNLIKSYFIGSSKRWEGATVFWQIDTQGKVRTGKIMLYNPTTGKRIKEPLSYINWVHKALKHSDFELKQCLFGEHLLKDKTKPVAIVESEKTAIIASVYLPQFIWVSVGALSNLSYEKCSILRGRSVTLFPDLNGFEKWQSKAKELSQIAHFTVSDLLERKASKEEREGGLDIADYLLRLDYKDFTILDTPEHSPINNPVLEMFKEQPEIEVLDNTPLPKYSAKPKKENWTAVIAELEQFFSSIQLPSQPIRLNQCSVITNIQSFIEVHLTTVKENNGKHTFLPFIHRLQELKQILS